MNCKSDGWQANYRCLLNHHMTTDDSMPQSPSSRRRSCRERCRSRPASPSNATSITAGVAFQNDADHGRRRCHKQRRARPASLPKMKPITAGVAVVNVIGHDCRRRSKPRRSPPARSCRRRDRVTPSRARLESASRLGDRWNWAKSTADEKWN